MANREEINALTGIRFIAATYVVLYHVGDQMFLYFYPELFPIYNIFTQNGFLGVELFFVLSGFILAYNYYDSFSKFNFSVYRGFVLKRFARVYPLHLLTLLLLFFFVLTKVPLADFDQVGPTSYDLGLFLKHLFLIQTWELPAMISWNRVSWSVSAEWFAYLLFPLFVIGTRWIASRRAAISAILVLYFLTGLVVLALFELRVLDHRLWNLEIALLRIILGFSVGVIIYLLVEKIPREHSSKPVSAVWVYLCLLTLLIPVGNLWGVPIFAWFIYLIAIKRSPFNSFLSQRWIVYGGKISYALYLVHGLLLEIILLAIKPEDLADAGDFVKITYMVSFVVISLLLASAAYHFVEEPCRRYIVGRGSNKRVIVS